MYNRYIPQPDGSYRKNRMQEPQQPKNQPPRRHEPVSPPPPIVEMTPEKTRQERQQHPNHGQDSITGFFKNLLPKDMDAGDLMVILLLLLMAGDCSDDKNTALLTLALYFFM